MNAMFIGLMLALAILFGAIAKAILWAIDTARVWWVRRRFLTGAPSAYIDAGRVHRTAQTRGRNPGGLDVSESLSRHTARRSREGTGYVAPSAGYISPPCVTAGTGSDDRFDGNSNSSPIQFPAPSGAPTRVS